MTLNNSLSRSNLSIRDRWIKTEESLITKSIVQILFEILFLIVSYDPTLT